MRICNKVKIIIAVWIGCFVLLAGKVPVLAAGSLSIAVSDSSVAAGDTLTVTVYAVDGNGAVADTDMTITYDSSILEFVSASGTGASGGGGTVNVTGSQVNVQFKAISSGNAYVKAEGADLTAAGAYITVGSTSSVSETSTVQEAVTVQETTTTSVLSGDNSLSSLTLSAGTLSPEFKGSVTNYTATVGSDVTDITVTPVTSNSKAQVESITGNTGLTLGENVIAITVRAENGTTATYKITVTKSDTVTAGLSNVQAVDSGEEAEGLDAVSDVTGTDKESIIIDGKAYHILDEIPESVIPEGFSTSHFEYKGVRHNGLSYDRGHMGLYYLVDEAGEGTLFVYDADRDGFYPYVRLQNGEHYIILMVVPNGAIPPNDYRATTVVINDVTVSAYQYFGKNVEIVNNEDTELPEGSTGSDFYLLYGMDPEGVAGWYQYDKGQGTYQRLNAEIASDEQEMANYDILLESYNELDTRYKDTKMKNRRVIAVLTFVTVVLLIVIINMALHKRGQDEESVAEEHIPQKKKEKEKPAKTYTRLEEEDDTSGFYDDDDENIMTEFEDEPSVLGKYAHPKKKEKPVREPAKPARKPEFKKEPKRGNHSPKKKEDDDIEFLDLNGL